MISDLIWTLGKVNQVDLQQASLPFFIEASGEKILYSKAVSDYSNQYDCTCLSFKAGDTIAVSVNIHLFAN